MKSIVIAFVVLVASCVVRADDTPTKEKMAPVHLLLKSDSTGRVVAKTTSNAQGEFTFTELPDGTYSISVTYQKIEFVCKSSKDQPICVTTARETGSGMATGRRQHAPVTFTKEWEASSPSMQLKIDGGTISGRLLPTVNK